MKTSLLLTADKLGLGLAMAGALLAQAGWAAPCSYSFSAPPGYSMIANQCDSMAPGGNTLNNVFPGVPAGCKIFKWNKVGQVFLPTAVFSGGVWSPNYTLDPGEGAFFHNPTASPIIFNISGNAHTPTPLVLPASGCCIASRQMPMVGGYMDIVGSPPQDGDRVYRYNPATASYELYTYDGLTQAWDPFDPMANIGESVWICRGGATPGFPCTPDVTPPSVQCVPLAGPGCNDAYQLLANDNCPCTLQIFIRDSCDGPCGGAFVAGPYAPGTKVKLKKNPNPCVGAPANVNPASGCGTVALIKTRGNPVLVVTDCAGNTTCQICPLP